MLTILKSALRKTPMYHPVRDNYLRLFKHAYWHRNFVELQEFYGQFVKPGSKVFDVGANVGNYTRCFVDLGAHVLAIEPQPVCIQEIETIRPRGKITIIPCAVGAKASTADMFVSDERSALGTLSPEWLDTARHSRRFSDVEWNKKITVPVVTLDSLIAKHGYPEFIKIDVEGFEIEVLDGLSYMPEALSFEFNSELPANSIACLNKAIFSKDVTFNYCAGECRLMLPEWISAREMISVLSSFPTVPPFGGDIFARRIH